MGGITLAGGTESKQGLVTCDLLDGEVALGEGAGFIHSHGTNLGQGLDGRTTLEQDALLAAYTDAGEEGQGDA